MPEGWHKDGFDFVAIINFNSENIEGGITRIKDNLINKNVFSAFFKIKLVIFYLMTKNFIIIQTRSMLLKRPNRKQRHISDHCKVSVNSSEKK